MRTNVMRERGGARGARPLALCTTSTVLLLGAIACGSSRAQQGPPAVSVPAVHVGEYRGAPEPARDDVTSDAAELNTAAQPFPGECAGEGLIISDGESNSNQSNIGGYWYTFADRSGSRITPESGALGGVFSMSAGGAEGSGYAARMWGALGQAAVVYAGMGVNFADPKGSFDVSRYSAIAFYARRAPDSTSNVRLKMPDANTDPDGKVCTECFNDFGADLTLTSEWRKYTLRFAGLKQLSGWGAPRPRQIDASKVFGVQFQVVEPGVNFDIWVDQLEFIRCR